MVSLARLTTQWIMGRTQADSLEVGVLIKETSTQALTEQL